MKRLLFIAAMAFPLLAQNSPNRFSATTGTVSLVAAAQAVTVQQPAAGGTPAAITLESATVYCSVTCVVTQTANGVAATATLATIIALPPFQAPSQATAYTASNFSGGTTIPPAINIPAGSTVVIDLSKMIIPKGNNRGNYTVSVGAVTGDVNITLIWSEAK